MSKPVFHVPRLPSFSRRRLHGSVTVEFLIGSVILFVATLALFQFFVLGVTQQTLVMATTEAARFGAMRTTDASLTSAAESARVAAEAYLDTQGLELVDSGPDADGVLQFERRLGAGPTETIVIGDGPPCPAAALPSLPLEANQVRVTLCFPLVDASAPNGVGNPIGNWLAGFGFDLSGGVMKYSAIANLE